MRRNSGIFGCGSNPYKGDMGMRNDIQCLFSGGDIIFRSCPDYAEQMMLHQPFSVLMETFFIPRRSASANRSGASSS